MKNGKLAAGIGGVTAVAAAVAITAGTYAAFSDEESGGVNATAGTMDLVVGGPPQDSNTYTFDNVVPGQDLGTETFTLTNKGSVDGILKLVLESVSNEEGTLEEPEREAGDTSADRGELLENLRISVYGETYTLTEGADGGTITLPQSLAAGETESYEISVSVPEDVGSEIQSDSAGFQVKAVLEQDTDQQ